MKFCFKYAMIYTEVANLTISDYWGDLCLRLFLNLFLRFPPQICADNVKEKEKVSRFRLGLFMTVGKRCVQETINALDVLDDMCDSLTSIKEIKRHW